MERYRPGLDENAKRMFQCAYNGDAEGLAVAAARVPDVWIEDGLGQNILHIVCSGDRPGDSEAALGWILENCEGAADLLNKPDAKGYAPLHCALAAAKSKCVRMLLHAGADPEMALPGGDRPLHMAAQRGFADAAAALLAAGANAREPGAQGKTALELALNPWGRVNGELAAALRSALDAQELKESLRFAAPGQKPAL